MVSQHLSEGIHRISPLERDIDQYLIHLRVEKGSSENTIASYARDLKRYVEFMASRGIIDAHRIRTADVRAFMRELAQPSLPRAGENRDSGHPSKSQGEKHLNLIPEQRNSKIPWSLWRFPSTPRIRQRLLQRVRVMSRCLCRWVLIQLHVPWLQFVARIVSGMLRASWRPILPLP